MPGAQEEYIGVEADPEQHWLLVRGKCGLGDGSEWDPELLQEG